MNSFAAVSPWRAHDLVLLIRDHLEQGLAQDVAALVMFEALDRLDGVPGTMDEVRGFVTGPLRAELERKAGRRRCDELLERIEQALRQPTDEEIESWTDEITETKQMPFVHAQPVPVIIVAGSARFATVLRTALGSLAVQTTVASDLRSLELGVERARPLVVIVDGRDPPRVPAPGVAAALRAIDDTVVRVVWNAESRYGERLLPELDAQGVACVRLDSRDGVSGLLDLVASRGGGA